MEKIEGIYTYHCNSCETVTGVVSRFGVSADRLSDVQCPRCKGKATLYGEGHIKYSIYATTSEKREINYKMELKHDYSHYPITLNATHVSELLGISRRYAYEIMSWSGFPTIQMGRVKRVNREDFVDWVSKQSKINK